MMPLYKGRHQVIQQFVITSNNSQEGFAEILLQKVFLIILRGHLGCCYPVMNYCVTWWRSDMSLDSWSCPDSGHRTVVNLFYLGQEYRRAGGVGGARRNDVV
jgi:hypothetical protein